MLLLNILGQPTLPLLLVLVMACEIHMSHSCCLGNNHCRVHDVTSSKNHGMQKSNKENKKIIQNKNKNNIINKNNNNNLIKNKTDSLLLYKKIGFSLPR